MYVYIYIYIYIYNSHVNMVHQIVNYMYVCVYTYIVYKFIKHAMGYTYVLDRFFFTKSHCAERATPKHIKQYIVVYNLDVTLKEGW